MKQKEVVLVRHGETEWTKTGRHTGLTDLPLTEQGKAEAKLAAEKLGNREFAAIFTSPLQRVTETAKVTGHLEQAQICKDLVEWDYGDYEGRTTMDIRKERPDWLLWRDGCPGGESPVDVGRRADQVIKLVDSIDGDVALYSSGHLLRVLAARWIDFPPAAGMRIVLDTATTSTLSFEHEYKVIKHWNESYYLIKKPLQFLRKWQRR